jgi:hypothetical protein
LTLPIFNANIKFPSNIYQDIGGGMAYDAFSKRVFYNDGHVWKPLSSGDATSVQSYAQIKDGVQIILANTDTMVTNWMDSAPYPTIGEWNLATGIYTAIEFQQFGLDISLSWSAGVSNLGTRILRVRYFDLNASTTSTIKEAVTQADANTGVETTQEASIYVNLNPGDMVWIEVSHNAPLSLSIASGTHTSISGVKIL